MPIVADAAARVSADTSPFVKDLKKLDGPVNSLGARIKASFSPAALLGGGLAAGFAATKVVAFLGDAVTAATNLNETITKTGQIFGEDALPALEEWAEGAAEAFGQSKQQALDAASTFAIFGKSAGLAGDDLVGFSQELVALSADFASFFNTSPEDAITAIGAALRGESEPIRRYGVLLDEATLRQRALKLGIIETTSQALTPQQRVLAAQAEILAQTADAQGDFVRTSDGLANQQRILEAQLADVTAQIGEELVPIMLELARTAQDTLVPALKIVAENVGAIGLGVETLFNPLAGLKHAFEDEAEAAEAAAERNSEGTRGWIADMNAAIPVAQGAAEDLAGALPEELDEAREDAVEIVRLTLDELTEELVSGQTDWQDAWDNYGTIMEEDLTAAQETAELKGMLTGQALADGLNSTDPERRAAAEAMKATIESRLLALQGNVPGIAQRTGTGYNTALAAYTAAIGVTGGAWATALSTKVAIDLTAAGRAASGTYMAGFASTTYSAAAGWLSGLKQMLVGNSPPPEGPLKDLDTGAEAVGQTYAESLVKGMTSFMFPSQLTDALLNPGLSAAIPASPVTAGLAVPGGTVNNYNLNVTGRLDVDESKDALDELRRLQSYSLSST